ncbi:MAG TPA: hypothetical protein H9902_09600 [Candidatus Stackebrandtia faecavium]|nr:hypothetical protein [Candidatus Stackebrandtia faecavium]
MKRALIIVGATAAGVVMFLSTLAIVGFVIASVVTAPFDDSKSESTAQRDAAQHEDRSTQDKKQEKKPLSKDDEQQEAPQEDTQPEEEAPDETEEAQPEEEAPQDDQEGADITKEEAYLNEMQSEDSGWQGTWEHQDDSAMLVVGDFTCVDLEMLDLELDAVDEVDSIVFEIETMYGVDTAAAQYQVKAAATHLCPDTLDQIPF